MDLLRRIAVDQRAAIIVVTHDEMIVDRFDHIFRLRDGRLESGADSGLKLEAATVR
jgi:putative ABC transport system ATP-binding protein